MLLDILAVYLVRLLHKGEFIVKKLFCVLLVFVLIFLLFSITSSADFGDNVIVEVEYNDDISYADRIYNDSTVVGSIDGNYDIDCFEVRLSSESLVYLIGGSDSIDVIIAIFDYTGQNCVAAVYPYYYEEAYITEIYTILPAGTYFVYALATEDSVSSYMEYLFYFDYEAHTHTYDNSCDATCNSCGWERITNHNYTSIVTSPTCEKEGYTTHKCSSCGDEYVDSFVEKTSHIYSNSCDSFCNVCNFQRDASHIYDNDCDSYCNVCLEYRTAIHKYDHGCDNECNICFEFRATEHEYDSDRDFICNNCNFARTPTQPVVIAFTSNAVMLFKYDDVEYSLDGINWQLSNIFYNLEDSKEYVVYQRVAPSLDVAETVMSEKTVFVTPEKPEYLSGDCNNDGRVNTSDLANLKLYLCSLDIVEIGADVNGDSVINTTDLAAIKLLLAGIILY